MFDENLFLDARHFARPTGARSPRAEIPSRRPRIRTGRRPVARPGAQVTPSPAIGVLVTTDDAGSVWRMPRRARRPG
jgi:hypothetical protein